MSQADDREALWETARTLRAHVEWLARQGVRALPVVASEVAPAVGSERIASARAAATSEPTAIEQPAGPTPMRDRRAPQAEDIGAARASLLVSPEPGPPATAPRVSTPRDLGEQRALAAIREELGECTRCKLHATRTKIVFGVGSETADLMFIGEGPGHDEDVSGIPFVGKAGQLLTKIIGAMGLERDDVYIANVVKCRPPQNRDPEVEEVASCSPFLFQQIASIRPKVIVALGRPACATLIGAALTTPISRLRGKWLSYRGQIPLMPTFHPAYLLRTPSAKREVWEDMKEVVTKLEALTGRTYQLATGKD